MVVPGLSASNLALAASNKKSQRSSGATRIIVSVTAPSTGSASGGVVAVGGASVGFTSAGASVASDGGAGVELQAAKIRDSASKTNKIADVYLCRFIFIFFALLFYFYKKHQVFEFCFFSFPTPVWEREKVFIGFGFKVSSKPQSRNL
jgi:hypothetical protein